MLKFFAVAMVAGFGFRFGWRCAATLDKSLSSLLASFWRGWRRARSGSARPE